MIKFNESFTKHVFNNSQNTHTQARTNTRARVHIIYTKAYTYLKNHNKISYL